LKALELASNPERRVSRIPPHILLNLLPRFFHSGSHLLSTPRSPACPLRYRPRSRQRAYLQYYQASIVLTFVQYLGLICMQGRDCIGNAKTGSGKTIAFALPILQKLSVDPYGIYALVITPTRSCLDYFLFGLFLKLLHPQRARISDLGAVRRVRCFLKYSDSCCCRWDGYDGSSP